MNEIKCFECAEPLRGLADVKFCSIQCLNAHNHKIYLQHNSLILSVNRILKKNHSILNMLLASGTTTTSKLDLQKSGYRFDFFTGKSISPGNKVCYYCYDRGLRELDHNNLVLIDPLLEDDYERSLSLVTERS